LPTVFARSQFERVLTTPLLGFSHDEAFETIADREIHPLALAVHAAFSEHRSLQITPDIIWLTIAQGFAQHINNNAEELRSSFVSHQGKEKLVAETEPPLDRSSRLPESILRELVQMLKQFNGATLYGDRDRAWHSLPTHEWEEYWNDDYPDNHLCCSNIASFIDLSDGRSIAFNFNFRLQKCWFLLGNKADEFASSTVIATSAIEQFDRMLTADGAYYFDEFDRTTHRKE
jgi:hypothetical protein